MSSIWDIINIPMGYVIKFCNWIMGNQYLLALLIFAIIIEILLLPFGIKQQKNSIKQARLRPKEMAIRKKYSGRNDRPTQQKMTEEIQALYQKEGYNPMGGCLPLLIQFPIIIALYNIVLNPLRYICGLSKDAIAGVSAVTSSFTGKEYDLSRNLGLASDMRDVLISNPDAYAGVQGFSEHIQDYTNVPNLNFLDRFNLGLEPKTVFESFASNWWLIVIPVVTFLAYFFSMKLTRKLTYQPVTDDKAMGCSNNMMDVMMPLMSVYIAFITPAAIGVYWIFKSILGVLKQFILKKAMPIPVFTEEDYKAAEKEVNARPEKNAPRNKSGRVVRSLHHIDDEDFEDTAEAGRARREALEAQAAADAEKKAEAGKKSLLSTAPVKNDEKAEKEEKADEPKAEEEKTSENNDNE